MWLRPLWIAGRFLTRLPFPDPGTPQPLDKGRSVIWYPIVGLLLGALISLAALVTPTTAPGVGAALILILWVWSTGGMHLDGLADSADAWVGGIGNRERTLEIMKDPRSGPAAVTAIALLLIAKWSGLEALLATGDAWLLVWIPLLARSQLPLLLLTTAYARATGLVSDQVATLPRRAAGLSTLAAALGCLLFAGWIGAALVTTAVALFFVGRRVMLGRLGGFTGDTAGALVEITETFLLLLAALLLGPMGDLP